MKVIGQICHTEKLGDVIVVEIYISLATQERVYRVRTASGQNYLVDESELN